MLLGIDSGKEVSFDSGSLEVDIGAVAYFDRLCTDGRDHRVVVNWRVTILHRFIPACVDCLSFCSICGAG